MTILPTEILGEGNMIAIRNNVVQTLGAVALRQALLVAAGALLPDSIAAGRWTEATALAILAGATVAYGQVKTWQQKRKALLLADAAPNGVVIGKPLAVARPAEPDADQ